MDGVGLPAGGTTKSALSHLEGALSGRRYDADRLIGLDPSDSKPLLARYDLPNAASTLTAEAVARRAAGGLWRWDEVLPGRESGVFGFIGGGATPPGPPPRFWPEMGPSHLLF